MATLRNTVALLALMALSMACTEKPSDSVLAETKARGLLASRSEKPVTIQFASSSENGAVVCGYARSGPEAYQPVHAFVIREERVVMLDDGVAAFEAAQRHCGPDWVGPRLQPGVP
jgi:hypothetical protein